MMESIIFSSVATNFLLRSIDFLMNVPEACEIGLRASSCRCEQLQIKTKQRVPDLPETAEATGGEGPIEILP